MGVYDTAPAWVSGCGREEGGGMTQEELKEIEERARKVCGSSVEMIPGTEREVEG